MSQQKRAVITTLAVLVVITVIVAAAMAANRSSGDESATSSQQSTTQSTDTTSNDTASDSNSSASYTDGEYTATGGYNTPGGSETLNVTITLKDGIVTDTSAEGSGGSRDSEEYQERFINNYKSQVVGKKIADIDLSRVSGSSLTPIGFNNALDQIKDQAS